MSDGEYLSHKGTHCPFCDSEHIHGGSVEIDGGSAHQEVTCHTCGKSWADLYNLVGYVAQS
jgi:transposase-like protein